MRSENTKKVSSWKWNKITIVGIFIYEYRAKWLIFHKRWDVIGSLSKDVLSSITISINIDDIWYEFTKRCTRDEKLSRLERFSSIGYFDLMAGMIFISNFRSYMYFYYRRCPGDDVMLIVSFHFHKTRLCIVWFLLVEWANCFFGFNSTIRPYSLSNFWW